MDVYVGDGDVVKMQCKKTGDRKNPNMHEWVLKDDALRLKIALETLVEAFDKLAVDERKVYAIDLAKSALKDT